MRMRRERRERMEKRGKKGERELKERREKRREEGDERASQEEEVVDDRPEMREYSEAEGSERRAGAGQERGETDTGKQKRRTRSRPPVTVIPLSCLPPRPLGS